MTGDTSLQLTRPAQDLLMSVCMNCSTHGAEDMDVISHLIKIRLKPKVLLNHYMLCIRCGPGRGPGGGREGAWVGGILGRRVPICSARVQGAAERTQGQPGHHHQVCDFQRALQRPEPKQHADPAHGAAAQRRAGPQGRRRPRVLSLRRAHGWAGEGWPHRPARRLAPSGWESARRGALCPGTGNTESVMHSAPEGPCSSRPWPWPSTESVQCPS